MAAELDWVGLIGLAAGAVLVGYLLWVGRHMRADEPSATPLPVARGTTAQDAAVERDRLLDQFEWLSVSCRRLTKALEASTVYPVVMSCFGELARTDATLPWVSLWLYDPLADTLRVECATPDPHRWLATDRLSVREHPLATVVMASTPLHLVPIPPSLSGAIRAQDPTSTGVVLVPFAIEHRLLGLVLMVCTPRQLERFQACILGAKLFTEQASLAVWNVLQRDLAMVDHLTRAYNYAYFKERISQELQRCYRFELPLTLLVIDIDGFKTINDTYGHQVGDRVLVGVVQTIKRLIRSSDLLARYGGDEFVLLLPELGRAAGSHAFEALPVAQRIREAIAGQPLHLVTQPLHVTVSIGLTVYDPRSHSTAPELFQQADEQLYRAKRAGKNRCALPDGSIVEPEASEGTKPVG